MTGHELALRWIVYHSGLDAGLGDAIVLGASRPAQLEESFQMRERGSLPDDLVIIMDDVRVAAEPSAPSYCPWVDVDGKESGIGFSVKEQ